jgi:hypothetical protein
MSAGHHVPSFGVTRRETLMDTPTGPAGRSRGRDVPTDANDIRRDARFTIHNLGGSGRPKRRNVSPESRGGNGTQSTRCRPLCIIYYFLDLINLTPTRKASGELGDIYVHGRRSRHKNVVARARAPSLILKESVN